jgi:hypothetical protein
MEDIHISSVVDGEMYAFAKASAADKSWPLQIVYQGAVYELDGSPWVLPSGLGGGYVGAARYLYIC